MVSTRRAAAERARAAGIAFSKLSGDEDEDDDDEAEAFVAGA